MPRGRKATKSAPPSRAASSAAQVAAPVGASRPGVVWGAVSQPFFRAGGQAATQAAASASGFNLSRQSSLDNSDYGGVGNDGLDPAAKKPRLASAYEEELARLREESLEIGRGPRPKHPGPDATSDMMKAYQDALEEWQGSVQMDVEALALQRVTEVQEREDRQRREAQRVVDVRNGAVIVPFRPSRDDRGAFPGSELLKCSPITELVAWMDAECSFNAHSDEFSVLMTRASADAPFPLQVKQAGHASGFVVVTDVAGAAFADPLEGAAPGASGHLPALRTPLHSVVRPSLPPIQELEAAFQATSAMARYEAAMGGGGGGGGSSGVGGWGAASSNRSALAGGLAGSGAGWQPAASMYSHPSSSAPAAMHTRPSSASSLASRGLAALVPDPGDYSALQPGDHIVGVGTTDLRFCRYNLDPLKAAAAGRGLVEGAASCALNTYEQALSGAGATVLLRVRRPDPLAIAEGKVPDWDPDTAPLPSRPLWTYGLPLGDFRAALTDFLVLETKALQWYPDPSPPFMRWVARELGALAAGIAPDVATVAAETAGFAALRASWRQPSSAFPWWGPLPGGRGGGDGAAASSSSSSGAPQHPLVAFLKAQYERLQTGLYSLNKGVPPIFLEHWQPGQDDDEIEILEEAVPRRGAAAAAAAATVL